MQHWQVNLLKEDGKYKVELFTYVPEEQRVEFEVSKETIEQLAKDLNKEIFDLPF